MTSLRVIVVDDDRLCRQTTRQQLVAAGYVAEAADSAAAALAALDAKPWDVVLTDLRMPRMDGVALMREIKLRFPDVDVMLMTAHGTVESAVAAMQEGAVDYLTKPFRFAELELRLRRLAEVRSARAQIARLRGILDEGSVGGIIGRSAPMIGVHERIALFAEHSAPVLITGETGTGKELVARAIHDLGSRRHGRFVAVACGAVPRELAESFFFGHEKGAFTGATERRRGCFEQAEGGTVLLDDVDDLPLDLQVKLLRVLQEGVVTRVGGDGEVRVDVRVVATTKEDLTVALDARRFRSDLYYRLRGLEIVLPPLRDRGDDVLLLATRFLHLIATEAGRSAATLSVPAIAALRAARWPGNVRELRRTMEAADALARGGEIGLASLPGTVREGGTRPWTLHLSPGTPVRLGELVKDFEDQIIGWAMAEADGQQTRAAELLGVPRTTLQSKLIRTDGAK